MTDSDWKAEILDDQITSLAPPGSGGAPVDRRWRLAAIVSSVAFALSVITLYPRSSANLGSLSATPSPSPVAAAAIPSPTPSQGPAPTRDEGPCRTDPIQLHAPSDRSLPGSYGPVLVPAGALAAFAIDEDGNNGSVVVAGNGGPEGKLVASYRTDPTRGNAYVNPVGWSGSGTTVVLRADQFGPNDGSGCSNLFLANADGSGVSSLTDFGPGTSIFDASVAPNSGLIAYSTPGEVRVLDPNAGERRIAECETAWQFRWSPDEQKFLGVCNDRDVLIVDIASRATVRATMPDGLDFAAAIWSGDGSSITVVGITNSGNQSTPTVLDFSLATLAFDQRPGIAVADPSFGFATISPSGRWMVLQDTQEGVDTAVLDFTTGVTTPLPKPPIAEPGAVPYTWESDGETGLYAMGGSIYAVNLATATLTEVGKMPPVWFVWRDAPAP
jgi:hypothetical protein